MIKDIKYELQLDGFESPHAFWDWSSSLNNFYFAHQYQNDANAIADINDWVKIEGLKQSKLIKITDWRIIKHWVEADEIGRELSKKLIIQQFLKYDVSKILKKLKK